MANRTFLSLLLISILAAPLSVFGATSTTSATANISTSSIYVGTPVQPKPITRLWYFVDNDWARESLFTYPGYIDVFAPQSYSTDKKGTLSGKVDPLLLDFAKSKGIKVMPLLVNAGFGTSTVIGLLQDKKAQDKLIKKMVAEAKRYHYWGWQLDFEQIPASYRTDFSPFVKKFGEAMDKAGLESSVAVMARFSDNPQDYAHNKKDLWDRIIGSYDYAAIGASVDFVSLMSYDDPESSGPITRYPWLEKVIDYSLTQIPADKLSLGLGLYYWKWDLSTGKRVGIGGREGVDIAIKTRNPVQSYNELLQAPYLSYKSGGVSYNVWFENARSVQKKLDLINSRGLAGFSAWALGLEQPSVYTVLTPTYVR